VGGGVGAGQGTAGNVPHPQAALALAQEPLLQRARLLRVAMSSRNASAGGSVQQE
jgi:hypothetical protein